MFFSSSSSIFLQLPALPAPSWAPRQLLGSSLQWGGRLEATHWCHASRAHEQVCDGGAKWFESSFWLGLKEGKGFLMVFGSPYCRCGMGGFLKSIFEYGFWVVRNGCWLCFGGFYAATMSVWSTFCLMSSLRGWIAICWWFCAGLSWAQLDGCFAFCFQIIMAPAPLAGPEAFVTSPSSEVRTSLSTASGLKPSEQLRSPWVLKTSQSGEGR